MLGCVLGAACVCAALAGLGLWLENVYINSYYLREDIAFRRDVATFQNFQKYVTANNLRTTDTGMISRWVISDKYTYLLFYYDDAFSFSAGWWGVDWDPTENFEDPDRLYFPVHFRDATVKVAIYDYSEYRVQDIWNYALFVGCCIVFLLIVMHYTKRLTRRIIRLSQAVETLQHNHLKQEIVPKGNDEIATLAGNIELLRQEVLENIEREHAAVQANADLLTAISHDIRTPLTALLGYLDLAAGGQYHSEEELRQYLNSGRDKTLQLKQLTDELFQYFMVFGNDRLPLQMEQYDAEILLEQVLGERTARLQLEGFTVKILGGPCHGTVRTDIQYLNRVLDNLMVNVEKHADRSKPVVVLVETEAKNLRISVTNAVPSIPNPTASTKIGLKSSEKIMEQMEGSLKAERVEHKFIAEVTLPLTDK